MPVNRQPRPVIVRRMQVSGGHGHHGGAWKVAYADFVTAMMAFFLLLWLISSASDDTLKGLADFFSNATVNVGPPGGVGGVLGGMTVLPNSLPSLPSSPIKQPPALPTHPEDELEPLGLSASEAVELPDIGAAAAPMVVAESGVPEAVRFDRAAAAILSVLHTSPELRPLKENLHITQTVEGLHIQILDRDRVPMFPLGSANMYPHTRKLLRIVVQAIAKLPNRVTIRGHTDALPFPPHAGYDNWHLSADRANATRLVMVRAGLDPKRVAEVVGRGDADPLVPGRADDSRNRRIAVVLVREAAAKVPPE